MNGSKGEKYKRYKIGMVILKKNFDFLLLKRRMLTAKNMGIEIMLIVMFKLKLFLGKVG